MTRSQLVKALARRHDLSRDVADVVVKSVLDGVQRGLCDGCRVEIRGFGTLRPRHYPGYLGRNPRTGERVVVEAKVLPVFRPGKALLERVAGRKE